MPNPNQPTRVMRGLLLAAAVLVPAARLRLVGEATGQIRLFRLVTMRTDMLVGLTPAELAALGSGPEVERIATRLQKGEELLAWRYEEARGPDGAARLSPRERIAIPGRNALLIEAFAPAMPVIPPHTARRAT